MIYLEQHKLSSKTKFQPLWEFLFAVSCHIKIGNLEVQDYGSIWTLFWFVHFNPI